MEAGRDITLWLTERYRIICLAQDNYNDNCNINKYITLYCNTS